MNDPLRTLTDRLKTLAHPARLRILAMLRDEEMCVCQIMAVLGQAASTVSEHLTELRRAGLLSERKEGRWVYYALSPHHDLERLLEALWPHLATSPQSLQDRGAAAKIRAAPLEITCSKTRCKSAAAK